MDIISEIISAIEMIVSLSIKYGPAAVQLAESLPNIIADLKFVYQSATAGEPLAPDQLQAIRDNLDRANQAAAALEDKAIAEDTALQPIQG